MLYDNPVLSNLQKQFRSQALSNIDNIYYSLACDIQDIVLAKQRGASQIELRALENKIEYGRNTIKNMLKK
jgi:hypothetical protein